MSDAEKTKKRHRWRALLSDTRGATDFIEKLLLIGLFAFVVAGAVTFLADSSRDKLIEQQTQIRDGSILIEPAASVAPTSDPG